MRNKEPVNDSNETLQYEMLLFLIHLYFKLIYSISSHVLRRTETVSICVLTLLAVERFTDETKI